jgi:hypothetical protein
VVPLQLLNELWHGWNSFSRLSFYSKQEPTKGIESIQFAQGNGESNGKVKLPRDSNEPTAYMNSNSLSSLVYALGNPKKILVGSAL